MREGRGRRRVVLLLGAAVYALLFALGSQIDGRGFTSPGQTALRFALALPACLGVLALLLGRACALRTWPRRRGCRSCG